MSALESLDISRNQLSYLPIWLVRLKYLKKLYARQNKLFTLSLCAFNDSDQTGTYFQFFKTSSYLTELDVSHNAIKAFPGNNDFFAKLLVLNISYNNIDDLSVCNICKPFSPLKELNVSHNSVERIPKAISNLKNLRVFDVSFNILKDFKTKYHLLSKQCNINACGSQTVEFKQDLQDLFCAGNDLFNVKHDSRLIKLSTIEDETESTDIIYRNLKSKVLNNESYFCLSNFIFHENIFKDDLMQVIMKKLYINITNCKLSVIPNFVELSKTLIELNLSNNQIKHICKICIQTLRYFDLSHNHLVLSKSAILQLPSLVSLILSFNKIEYLDLSFLGNCSKLELLDVSNNNVTDLIEKKCKNNLTTLILSHNNINEVSDNFVLALSKLKSLRNLLLNGNRITKVSPNLFKLRQLHKLNLANNKLAYLPDAFDNRINLNDLNIMENNINSLPPSLMLLQVNTIRCDTTIYSPPQVVLRNGPAAVKAYYDLHKARIENIIRILEKYHINIQFQYQANYQGFIFDANDARIRYLSEKQKQWLLEELKVLVLGEFYQISSEKKLEIISALMQKVQEINNSFFRNIFEVLLLVLNEINVQSLILSHEKSTRILERTINFHNSGPFLAQGDERVFLCDLSLFFTNENPESNEMYNRLNEAYSVTDLILIIDLETMLDMFFHNSKLGDKSFVKFCLVENESRSLTDFVNNMEHVYQHMKRNMTTKDVEVLPFKAKSAKKLYQSGYRIAVILKLDNLSEDEVLRKDEEIKYTNTVYKTIEDDVKIWLKSTEAIDLLDNCVKKQYDNECSALKSAKLNLQELESDVNESVSDLHKLYSIRNPDAFEIALQKHYLAAINDKVVDETLKLNQLKYNVDNFSAQAISSNKKKLLFVWCRRQAYLVLLQHFRLKCLARDETRPWDGIRGVNYQKWVELQHEVGITTFTTNETELLELDHSVLQIYDSLRCSNTQSQFCFCCLED